MTNILAIETSATTCSVALNTDGRIAQLIETTPREHARKVLPMIDAILTNSGLSVNGLDAIALTIGPGSFTGLRIGFGVVQGIAFGIDIPVIGIPTFQCMAFKAGKKFDLDAGIVVPAFDARMQEIYWGVYSLCGGGLPVALRDDAVSTPETAKSLMPQQIDVAVGEGWKLLSANDSGVIHSEENFEPDAESLAEMAYHRYIKREFQDILSVELSYIRNEVSWKKRQKIRT